MAVVRQRVWQLVQRVSDQIAPAETVEQGLLSGRWRVFARRARRDKSEVGRDPGGRIITVQPLSAASKDTPNRLGYDGVFAEGTVLRSGMDTNRISQTILVILAAFWSTAPVAAYAQEAPVLEQQPPFLVPDENGVDLRTGSIADYSFMVTVGAADAPAIEVVLQRNAGSGAPVGTPFYGRIAGVQCMDLNMASWCTRYRSVEFGGYSEWFVATATNQYPFVNYLGETYTVEGGLHVITLRDGTRVRFDPSKAPDTSATNGDGVGRRFFNRLALSGPNLIVQHRIVSSLTSVPRWASIPSTRRLRLNRK